MRLPHREFPQPWAYAAISVLAAACLPATAIDTGTPSPFWLLPQRVYGSSLLLPGERWEGHLTGERSISLQPGMEWQTLTDLSRTRFDQLYPMRSQGVSLSTGPRIRMAIAEIDLRWNAGRDSRSVGTGTIWSGSAPRMTVALGPNDRVRLEAKLSRRTEGSATQRRRTTALSWRHSFSDDWSLTAGLRQTSESGDSADSFISAETYASIDARSGGGWRWSLASSLSDARHIGATGLQPSARDRSLSVSLSTRYRLSDGWWISSELKSTQTQRGDTQPAPTHHSGGLKLYRNF